MSDYAIAQLWIHGPVTYGRYVGRFECGNEYDLMREYRDAGPDPD